MATLFDCHMPTMGSPTVKSSATARDMDAASVEKDSAIQLLRAQQNAYYIQAVQTALEAEEQRKARLAKVSTHLEAKRLEKQFARERQKDKERLEHVQEDHALLLNAKVDEWKASGGVVAAPQVSTVRSTARAVKKSDGAETKPVVALSKERLERLAMPRVPSAKAASTGSERPSSASRSHGDTSQEVEFYKAVYRKHDRSRLTPTPSLPALTAGNLHAMSEVDLLRRKQSLLSALHGVVTMQERITQDDQWTVRSSVSSWKSGTAAFPATNSSM